MERDVRSKEVRRTFTPAPPVREEDLAEIDLRRAEGAGGDPAGELQRDMCALGPLGTVEAGRPLRCRRRR